MGSFTNWIQTTALALGGPGLFIVAFLDSSFLSLPEINDLLLIWMVTQHKTRMPYYAVASMLGSVAGCLVLYYIGRVSEQWVAKRFSADRMERTMKTFQRYGVMAVLIPSLLPPPAPFKIFVLLAGVAGISVPSFALAIALGRGIRYFGEGLLAIWYGDRAIEYVAANGRRIGLGLVTLLAIALAAYILRKRAQRQKAL
jgi:membrane protein YqaA with SNARE-associated domain